MRLWNVDWSPKWEMPAKSAFEGAEQRSYSVEFSLSICSERDKENDINECIWFSLCCCIWLSLVCFSFWCYTNSGSHSRKRVALSLVNGNFKSIEIQFLFRTDILRSESHSKKKKQMTQRKWQKIGTTKGGREWGECELIPCHNFHWTRNDFKIWKWNDLCVRVWSIHARYDI